MVSWRRLGLLVLGLLWIAGFVEIRPGHAYLLPASQILEFVSQQTSKVCNFRLRATAETPDPDHPGDMIRKKVVYYGARPDFLRQENLGTPAESVTLVGSGRRLSLIGGQLLKERARHEDIFPVLLFADSAKSLEKLLTAEQVDTRLVHFGRLGREIAYVIGARPGDDQAPQFWCDKEHFWPLRLVGRRTADGIADVVDIRYLSYRQVARGIWMPASIEFYRRGQLFLRLTVEQATSNLALPQRLFDLESFAAGHPSLSPRVAPSKEPAGALEKMQRYLEKKYE